MTRRFASAYALVVVCSCGGRAAVDTLLRPDGHPGMGGAGGHTSIDTGGTGLGGRGVAGNAATGGVAGGVASGGTSTGGVVGSAGSGGAHDAGTPALQTPFATAECFIGNIETTPESLSHDGRWFVYSDSGRTTLLDRTTGVPATLSRGLTEVDPPWIAGGGDRVLFGAGNGNESRAYIWDRTTDGFLATFPVGDGVSGVLSRDGRFLAFYSRDAASSDPPPYFQGGSIVVDLSTNERWQASVNDSGEPGNDYSFSVDISDDGQRVVFRSVAMNLVPGKPNRRWDVFLYDRSTQRTTLAAASMNGGYPDDYTMNVSISGDGRTLAFESKASDIVAGDEVDTLDVFVRDIATDAVSSFTLAPTIEKPALVNLSSDGRYVLFRGDSDEYVVEDRNGDHDAFIYDRLLDRFELVTRARDGRPLGDGGEPIAISGDGRVVAFHTDSPELSGDGGGVVTCFSVRIPASGD